MTGSPDYRGRRVLVTGSGGFIGAHLCRKLAEEGAVVFGTGRGAVPPRLAGSVHWLEGDLRENGAVRRALEASAPELVFHLASVVSGSRDLELVLPTLEVNLVVAVQLLAECTRRGISRVVLAGSLEEPESQSDAPTSPYAAAKTGQELYARMFRTLYGLDVVTARLFMVYGPGQMDAKKLLPYVIGSLMRGEKPSLSSGTRDVDWVFIDDVIEALILLGQADGIAGQVIDVGTGDLTTVRSVVEQVARRVDPSIAVEFGGLPDRSSERVRAADVERTARAIGWRAATSLEEGIARTVEWYKGWFADLHS